MRVVVPPKAAARVPVFEIVGASRPAEGHIEVSVNVDSTGHHKFACRIQILGCILGWKINSNGVDLAVRDRNVCRIGIRCRHDGTVLDNCVETHRALRRFGAAPLAR